MAVSLQGNMPPIQDREKTKSQFVKLGQSLQACLSINGLPVGHLLANYSELRHNTEETRRLTPYWRIDPNYTNIKATNLWSNLRLARGFHENRP